MSNKCTRAPPARSCLPARPIGPPLPLVRSATTLYIPRPPSPASSSRSDNSLFSAHARNAPRSFAPRPACPFFLPGLALVPHFFGEKYWQNDRVSNRERGGDSWDFSRGGLFVSEPGLLYFDLMQSQLHVVISQIPLLPPGEDSRRRFRSRFEDKSYPILLTQVP